MRLRNGRYYRAVQPTLPPRPATPPPEPEFCICGVATTIPSNQALKWRQRFSIFTTNTSLPDRKTCHPSRPGWTFPRSCKTPSDWLIRWLNSPEVHGYEFNEDVLFGLEPDTDWTRGYMNQPTDWNEVAKCLRSEIDGQEILSVSEMYSDCVNVEYWKGCEDALEEVMEYYV